MNRQYNAIDFVNSLHCPNPECNHVFAAMDGGKWSLNDLGIFELHCPDCGRYIKGRLTAEVFNDSAATIDSVAKDLVDSVQERRDEAETNRRGIEILKQKSEQHGAQVCTTDGRPPDPDYAALGSAPRPIKSNGQHESYYVLCAEERANGFCLPVRNSYLHVGIRPQYPLRDLTPEEKETHKAWDYVKYEEYPKSETTSVVGRFWTERDLHSGCNGRTTMGQSLAETVARDPSFYGATMCVHCGRHFAIGETGEFIWDDGSGHRVGGKEDLEALKIFREVMLS